MPNFVKVDSKPFHPDTYVGPEHEDDFASGTHERDMGIKLRVENTVRWRWVKDKDGQDVRLLFPFFLVNGAEIALIAASSIQRACYPMVGRLYEPPARKRVL